MRLVSPAVFGASTIAVAKSFISVAWEGFSVATQIVVLIALVFLIGKFQYDCIFLITCTSVVALYFITPIPSLQNMFVSFLPVTLASAKTILRNENSEDDYEYYHAPAYSYSGYDASGSGSSYAAGYSKRSADFPSFLNLPIVQRLTERVHQAIESYSAQN